MLVIRRLQHHPVPRQLNHGAYWAPTNEIQKHRVKTLGILENKKLGKVRISGEILLG